MNTHIKHIFGFFFIVLIASAWLPSSLAAHHGWGWATENEFEITGRISDVRLGNPHGEVTIMVDNEAWVVEVGQPWRNEQAGLTDDLLQPGKLMTVHGHRSAKQDERLVKAERVVIEGQNYNLYPDRKS